MLFNSYTFIFGFFPVTLIGFFLIGRSSDLFALLWLAAASLLFYGWWDPRYVGLLIGSIILNYFAGYYISQKLYQPKILLTLAIFGNLTLLIYFKYANFFVDNLSDVMGVAFTLPNVVLPLGISFYTFTQIAFLVDTYQGKVKEFKFFQYLLFITYFPHLIAGPLLHNAEIMPQFGNRSIFRVNWTNIAVGLSIFILGLTKKIFLADSIASFSNPVFQAVKDGYSPMLIEAWTGALSYTLQIYFDFSGYCDMAIGLSLMFNVFLPINFNSPYKATSIVEFWRSWNITLSHFLRDYLYIPLGGNIKGNTRRYINLMITMILGGLWHGASWNFVIWGALHGIYLLINHAWRDAKLRLRWGCDSIKLTKLASGALTFVAVVVGWVFFRADSISSALTIIKGMAGINGVSLPAYFNFLPHSEWLKFDGNYPLTKFENLDACLSIVLCLLIVFLMPNLHSIFNRHQTVYEDLKSNSLTLRITMHSGFLKNTLIWRPSLKWAFLIAISFYLCFISLTKVSEFIYFQF